MYHHEIVETGVPPIKITEKYVKRMLAMITSRRRRSEGGVDHLLAN
jgi:hypothetical protein